MEKNKQSMTVDSSQMLTNKLPATVIAAENTMRHNNYIATCSRSESHMFLLKYNKHI